MFFKKINKSKIFTKDCIVYLKTGFLDLLEKLGIIFKVKKKGCSIDD